MTSTRREVSVPCETFERAIIAILRATGVPLRADHQQTADELAQEQFLREGDFE